MEMGLFLKKSGYEIIKKKYFLTLVSNNATLVWINVLLYAADWFVFRETLSDKKPLQSPLNFEQLMEYVQFFFLSFNSVANEEMTCH